MNDLKNAVKRVATNMLEHNDGEFSYFCVCIVELVAIATVVLVFVRMAQQWSC